MWVYIRSERRLWTVGFYDPAGKWHPESDHEWPQSAAARCAVLNGGRVEDLLDNQNLDDADQRVLADFQPE